MIFLYNPGIPSFTYFVSLSLIHSCSHFTSQAWKEKDCCPGGGGGGDGRKILVGGSKTVSVCVDDVSKEEESGTQKNEKLKTH